MRAVAQPIRIAWLTACLSTLFCGAAAAQHRTSVSGRVTVLDDESKQARDVGQAVVWLESANAPSVTPDTVRVLMSDKEYRPRVVVLPVGSVVSFPNEDPFNHNVFSRAPEATFDLGLYGRGRELPHQFETPGVIRIYCNVHPRMIAFVVVRDNGLFTQPSADGRFTISGVPAGTYTLHAWHERAEPVQRTVEVSADGLSALQLELDARGYEWVQHANKHGRPYRSGRRY